MNEIAWMLQLMAEDARSGSLKASEGELQIAQAIFSYTKHVPPAELMREILK